MTDGPRARLVVTLVFLTSLAGIQYELLLGTVSSLLLGDSVREWSLTIGVFLSAMGLGSYLSRFVDEDPVPPLVRVQVLVAAVGAVAPLGLFAVYAGAEVLLRGATLGVLLALGTGIGVEIPLLTRLLREGTSLKDALAYALAVDYLGALAASLAYPLVLYPALGVVRTAGATALINVGVAIVLLRSFPRAGGGKTRAALLAVATLALAVLVGADAWTLPLSRAVFRGEVVWAERSPYQEIALVRNNRGDTALLLDRKLQFLDRDEARYHQALVHVPMAAASSTSRVLILGGGDGLALREVWKWPVESATLVDLDEAVVDLARTHPAVAALNGGSFGDARLNVVIADAGRWVADQDAQFDVVLIDLPDPSRPSLARLYATEFYAAVARRLALGGVLVTQATSPYFTRRAYWCVVDAMEDAGLQVVPYHVNVPSFGEWGFVLGSATAVAPRRPTVEAPYLQAWDALFAFPPDMARPATRCEQHALGGDLTALYEQEARLVE